MQRLEVRGAVRPIYGSLGVKRLNLWESMKDEEVKTSSQLVPFALVTKLHFADNNGPTPPYQNLSIKTPYFEVLNTKFVNGMFLV